MRIALALLLSFLAACTQTRNPYPADAGPTDGGTGPLPGLDPAIGIAKYCEETHRAICESLASCECPMHFRGGSVEACAERRASDCVERIGSLVSLMQQGKLKITQQSIDDCVSGLRALGDGCWRIDDDTLPIACAGYFMDTAGLGEPCRLEDETHLCADGFGLCRDSICTALPKEGESCRSIEACAPGATCIDHKICVQQKSAGESCEVFTDCVWGLRCIQGQCAEPLADGATCEGDEHCESVDCDEGRCEADPELGSACSAANACGDFRECVGSIQYRRCAAKAAEGDSCVTSEECAAGLVCSDVTSKCVKLPTLGEECVTRQYCAEGLVCDENENEGMGKCVTPPGDGEACLIGNAACAPELACDENNVCRPPPSVDGDPCAQPGNRCGAGLACDFTESGSFCRTRRDVGGNCQNDVICKDGLRCDGNTGKCAEPQPLDSKCSQGNECGPGRECNNLGGRGYRCVEKPSTVGVPCLFECGNDLACRGPGGECARAICSTR